MVPIKFPIFGLKRITINLFVMALNRTFFLIALLLITRFTAFSQIKAELKLLTQAEDFKIQERVLLTPDQDFYLVGEQINFFALTFDAAMKIPIEFSSVLYVELYNQDNTVINAMKFLLNHGQGTYNFTIPRQLETGYYYIRAYTNYMKNFGPGSFFTKRIKIINPFYEIKYRNSVEPISTKLQLNIAVEGGTLLYSLENKISFLQSLLALFGPDCIRTIQFLQR